MLSTCYTPYWRRVAFVALDTYYILASHRAAFIPRDTFQIPALQKDAFVPLDSYYIGAWRRFAFVPLDPAWPQAVLEHTLDLIHPAFVVQAHAPNKGAHLCYVKEGRASQAGDLG
jgi:hypothetical protein